MKRKTILWAGGAAVGLLIFLGWAGASVQAPDLPFDVTEVDPGVFSFRWNQHRNVFVITADGVVVTDPISPSAAALLQEEIRKRTSKPVTHVVYSHEHWDHILGAAIFKSEGASVISHARCMPAFARHPHPDLVLPDTTFSGTRHEFETGGRRFELLYFGPNHGECLIVMRIVDVGILYAPDLVTPNTIGFRTLPDYRPMELIDSLARIEDELDFERVVGGHGPPQAARSAVTEERLYYERLMAEVGRLWNTGIREPDELIRRVQLPEYRDWAGYEWLPLNVERVWAYYHMGW